jgi:hypothetical protein
MPTHTPYPSEETNNTTNSFAYEGPSKRAQGSGLFLQERRTNPQIHEIIFLFITKFINSNFYDAHLERLKMVVPQQVTENQGVNTYT